MTKHYTQKRCEANKTNGHPCMSRAMSHSRFCVAHDPATSKRFTDLSNMPKPALTDENLPSAPRSIEELIEFTAVACLEAAKDRRWADLARLLNSQAAFLRERDTVIPSHTADELSTMPEDELKRLIGTTQDMFS